jgi:hypothetical protein
MTTQIIVEVPESADYDVLVHIKEKVGFPNYDASKMDYIERIVTVYPGDRYSMCIYGDQKFISGIREVKRIPV